MQLFPSLVYLPPIFGIVLIGLMTLYKRKNEGIIYFSYMSFAIAIWLFIQYVAQLRFKFIDDLFIIQLSSAVSNFIPIFFLLFITKYLKIVISKHLFYIFVICQFALFISNFTKLMITEVEVTNHGIGIINAGALYFLQIFISFLAYIYGLVKLQKASANAISTERIRFQLLFFGILQTLIINILGTAVFVDSIGIQIAMVESFLLMIIFFGYAIIKHKLFDIRLIVARSIGYILTLLTIAGGYSFLVFVVFAQFLGARDLSNFQQALYVVLALIFGFSLPPLKRFFDRATNQVFYRDAYDAQELLDGLNKVLVGNIDLQPLLRETSEIIGSTIKAEYCLFVIRETAETSRRIIGSRTKKINDEQLLTLTSNKKGGAEIIVADEIESTDSKVKQVMKDNDISIMARLAATGSNKTDQGYLLLGAKKSGNPYNRQDLQVLDIIANELVIAIQNALRFEEIEAFNVVLQQKVNEATRKLRLTNEKLKEIDETKDEFISMASHQLRTPLTSVKGYVSMVVEGDAGKLNKQQKELLNQAFASSQRMVYLIADLLNVSRLKTGKFVIENKPTQLADVIETEMGQLQELAQTKQQTLTYKKPKDFPMLNMDETKIRQVIMNFTDNALHYTPNGGHIEVNLIDKGESIEFTVVDDGLGVPKGEQHHLFTKFYRAGNAKKARPDGTGLGLFMAKKVIIAQGGAVIFNSVENKGSTFGFTFPKAVLKVTKTDTSNEKA